MGSQASTNSASSMAPDGNQLLTDETNESPKSDDEEECSIIINSGEIRAKTQNFIENISFFTTSEINSPSVRLKQRRNTIRTPSLSGTESSSSERELSRVPRLREKHNSENKRKEKSSGKFGRLVDGVRSLLRRTPSNISVPNDKQRRKEERPRSASLQNSKMFIDTTSI